MKKIERVISEIFVENHGNYGYRRIDNELRNRGIVVNHKKIQRIKQKLGLQSVKFTRKSRKYNTYKGNVGTVEKNRIHRRYHTSIPHQKLTTDTSEFKYFITGEDVKVTTKKAYLDAFLDMFNGEIISYRLSERLNAQAIHDAQLEAIERTSDCPFRRTFHSDRGWAYQMKQYANLLKNNKIFQSMSRKGNCVDNSPMENFFGQLKQEMYYGTIYTSFEEIKQAIDKYIYYYNHKRIKSKLGCSPVTYRVRLAA